MKKFLAVMAVSLVAQPGFASDPLRSGYEVVLTDGKDRWEANTVTSVEDGRIQQGLGPYVVSMSVEEGLGDKYTLRVRVTGLPGSSTADAEFIRKTFEGNHTQQLEFSASEGDLAVKGVIFIGRPRQASR